MKPKGVSFLEETDLWRQDALDCLQHEPNPSTSVIITTSKTSFCLSLS